MGNVLRTGTWRVTWKTGIPIGFMGWSRVTRVIVREREPQREEYTSQAHCQPGTTATKKDKRSTNGDNSSCGIANEPSGHPNDGWLGGAESKVFGLRCVSRKFHFLARRFLRLPLGEEGCLKYPEALPFHRRNEHDRRARARRKTLLLQFQRELNGHLSEVSARERVSLNSRIYQRSFREFWQERKRDRGSSIRKRRANDSRIEIRWLEDHRAALAGVWPRNNSNGTYGWTTDGTERNGQAAGERVRWRDGVREREW